ncbi:uncharacterized protein SETTUDRAFT_167358 [Exserohilum turcica Et28A]|uniref:Uncharacterized protein n=1 Tax=Exserohilum turcicum (strain 28A) TaxID=671987 RepID=R0J0P8_EXST2|nr:uncharacterized protein SETTUDRAFT_167358 [Exserohilum turcica Et28A]EOA90540.1 hypothetical protein SETTUDRAFT_167358 [Exserohilum turcica Et28A]
MSSTNDTASAPCAKPEDSSSTSAAQQLKEGFPEDHAPIAMFTQPIRGANRSFQFLGWYKINRLQLLEPGSEDLVRRLSKKWETVDRLGRVVPRQRDLKKWKESMSYRWAVIKMERDEEAEKERGYPKIERIDEDDGNDGEGQ